MAKFRNISGVDRNLGRINGLPVKAGDVAVTPGEVTEELPDAYIVGAGDQARAWPKETWQLVKDTAARAADKGND